MRTWFRNPLIAVFSLLLLAAGRQKSAAEELVDLFASDQVTTPVHANEQEKKTEGSERRMVRSSGTRSRKGSRLSRGNKVYRIDLKQMSDGTGRLGGARGKADQTGDRMGMKGLSLFEPVDLILEHRGISGVLVLEIFKYAFNVPLAQKKATPERPAVIRLRTQGEVRIRVRAEGASPLPYRLLVHVGPEQEELVSPHFAAKEAVPELSEKLEGRK